MRGVDGTQEPAGSSLNSFRLRVSPAACPWGCVLGPEGWSDAPFCPLHRPPGAAEAEHSLWQVRGDLGRGGGCSGLVPPLQLRVTPPVASSAVNRSAMGEVSGTCDVLHHDLDFWDQKDFCEEYSEEEDDDEYEDEAVENGDWVGFNEPWVFEDGLPPFPYLANPFEYQRFVNLFGDHDPPESVSLPSSLLEAKMGRLPAPQGHQLTAEEAERNAQELVAEEERVKKKAEKKRLKKKKQKDRKKREKLEQEQKSALQAKPSTPAAGVEHPQTSSAEKGRECPVPNTSAGPRGSLGEEEGGQRSRIEELEDELDLSCSFVSKAREKAGVRLPGPSKEKPGRADSTKPGRKVPGKVPKPEALDTSMVEQSLVLAGRGNEAAQQGRYAEAVQVFTEAMRLNPQEHRLFGNRSYCYEKLQRYEEALRDAQESLRLQPGWPKGFFRKGKALRGLQRYAEAACTFEKLLHQDGANAEVASQLKACHALLLQGSHQSSPGGIPMSISPLEATEPPLSPSGKGASMSCQNRSGFVTIVSSRNQAKGQGHAAARNPSSTGNFPTLPRGHPARDCYPLWVGNITHRISEKVLQRAFGRFGEIRFIRMLPERRCAFVNYTQKKAAEEAYMAMKEAELEGSRLVLQLKHPSHATPPPWQHPEHPHPLCRPFPPPPGPVAPGWGSVMEPVTSTGREGCLPAHPLHPQDSSLPTPPAHQTVTSPFIEQ
ncbi:tetratricopeptide repeat protein 31 [Indicator indicator]|uniref:tetratricopeptide repeat protein 31 n=1 Tax=Indicator indicator TaxID=1002788 RepID=UPI0023DF2C4B|nr:tetratricopeptide repeat protein 31 [Indicator indicator]